MRGSALLVGLLAASLGCGDNGSSDDGGGMLPPQESVSDGTQNLSAKVEVYYQGGPAVFGLASEEVADEWTVEYAKFLVTIGTVTLTLADGTPKDAEVDAVVDLLQANTALQVATVEGLPAGSAAIEFTMPDARPAFTTLGPVTLADRDLMADNGWSLYVAGTIRRKDGLSCMGDDPPLCTPAPEVKFAWGAAAGSMITDCPEVVVEADAAAQKILTLPGDRWLRTDFQLAGAAPPVLRAQWIADADANRDGEATLDELATVEARAVLSPLLGYDVRAGAPLRVKTLHDFFVAQARMVGREALGCATVLEW